MICIETLTVAASLVKAITLRSHASKKSQPANEIATINSYSVIVDEFARLASYSHVLDSSVAHVY